MDGKDSVFLLFALEISQILLNPSRKTKMRKKTDRWLKRFLILVYYIYEQCFSGMQLLFDIKHVYNINHFYIKTKINEKNHLVSPHVLIGHDFMPQGRV